MALVTSLLLTTLVLLCPISAQLLTTFFRESSMGSSFQKVGSLKSAISLDQEPHILKITDQTPRLKQGQFNIKQQDCSLCTTHGESQWTGTIDVTNEHHLFFWYFDSRNDPDNDPIILWINGGPGSSSMAGLFNEIGPCVLPAESNSTVPNEWSWNNNASVLFLDQPAGVGFSSVFDGSPVPKAVIEGAEDFQAFLNDFFSKIFPSKADLPIRFAAESYGGHYGSTYIDHVMTSRKYNSKNAFWGTISSLILVDAVIDFTAPCIGAYEMLCCDLTGVYHSQ